jgi:Tol biopolymer transport system component
VRTCFVFVATLAMLAALATAGGGAPASPMRLPDAGGAPHELPAATPQKIAFARVFPNAGQLKLFIASSDGGDERPLLTSSDLDYDPAWSPDGASIVFTSERAGSADLFRANPDGSGLERLTEKWIAFSSDREGGLPFGHGRWERLQLADVYCVRPDGSQLKRITTHGNFCGSPKSFTRMPRSPTASCS